jgi:sRNA-binding regulator protein Hfq
MANSSPIPVTGSHEVRPSSTASPAVSAVPEGHDADQAINNTGPRKLVRPPMLNRNNRDRGVTRSESPIFAHGAAQTAVDESSHSEAFYFQKQIQTQTLMAFVLADGETIEGYIEWYDRNAIKVRNGSRTLIYKSCIKYLYKVGENPGQ